MINFTNCIEDYNFYKGSEMKKTLIYNDKKYLVKFPDPIRQKNKSISYINNTFAEYIGTNIFRICGFETQNTILGMYDYNGKEKIVCACEDFTDEYNRLCGFEALVLSNNFGKKIDTELSDILEFLKEICNNSCNFIEIKNKFWEMFIIDSLIGNTDRHNGNWGFLINKDTKAIKFSPIYDCGSCLNPMFEDEELDKLTDNEKKNLSINCHSCLKIDGKRINYMSFIKSMENKDCNDALIRMIDKIDINKINEFIDSIDCISMVRKEFYKFIIKERYFILKSTYDKLINE